MIVLNENPPFRSRESSHPRITLDRNSKVVCATIVGLSLSVFASPAIAQFEGPATDAPAPVSPDFPPPVLPVASRSEQEEDRVTAQAYFALGRMLQQRGDKAGALRCYQRTWRWDPRATAALTEVPTLAFELKRNEVAARYAVLAAEMNSQNPILVRRLALYLTERGDWDRAVRLYERSIELQPIGDSVGDLGEALLLAEMGRLYFLNDEFEKAADAVAKVQQALETTPSPLDEQSQKLVLGESAEESYALWAECHLAAKRFDEARALFEKANTVSPNAGMLALRLARVEHARGNVVEARKHLESYWPNLSADDGDAPFELLQEIIAAQTLQADEASRQLLDRLSELSAKHPDHVALAIYRGRQLIAAKRYAEAQEELERAVEKQPSDEAYAALIEVAALRGEIAPLLKTLSAVVEQGDVSPAIPPAIPPIIEQHGLLPKLLAATRRQQQDAPQSLGKRQLAAVGLLALEAQEWDTAAELLEAQIAADPSLKPSLLLRLGTALHVADRHERAAKVFQRMIDEKALPKTKGSVYFLLAGALEMSGQTDAALAAAGKAVELEPDAPLYANRLGWVLYHAKRYEDADKAYREVVATYDAEHSSPRLREMLRDTRMALSAIALERDDFAAAVEWAEQALDEFPEDAGVLNDLGYIWTERGLHKERALAMTKKAVAAEPDNGSYRDSLGWALFQLGRYDEAANVLAEAVKFLGDEPSGVVLDHFGDALQKAGKPAEAQAAWNRAITAFQKEGETEKLNQTRKKLASSGK